LDPDYVTQQLGVTPSHAHRRGQVRGKGHGWKEGQWSLSSKDQPIPRDLEDHLAWLLDKIELVREAFLELYTEDVSADMFCYLECYGLGGPELSPVLMKRLAKLDLFLGLDIYIAERGVSN
jgi:hypothetical protein